MASRPRYSAVEYESRASPHSTTATPCRANASPEKAVPCAPTMISAREKARSDWTTSGCAASSEPSGGRNKKVLKGLEDDLLYRLANSEGNLLSTARPHGNFLPRSGSLQVLAFHPTRHLLSAGGADSATSIYCSYG